MFKDPRAALRAGLESYHSGKAGASIEALRYAADGGEYLAQWKLGRMYAEGDGVARDDHKAFDYFSKIVEHFSDDDPDPSMRSMVVERLCLGRAISARRDRQRQARGRTPSARSICSATRRLFGDADAQYNVARMYLDGVGVKKDIHQGMNWLDLAARKGHAPAQALLGEMMFNGEASGAAQRPRGLMYLTLAREIGSGTAADQWIIDLTRQGAGFGQRSGSPGRRRHVGKLSAPSRLEALSAKVGRRFCLGKREEMSRKLEPARNQGNEKEEQAPGSPASL